jgi:hypothetical protein
MPRARVGCFVVQDDDAMRFDVVETSDDEWLLERVDAAQQQGRKVRYYSVESPQAVEQDLLGRGFNRGSVRL